jgi:hypothetical protein
MLGNRLYDRYLTLPTYVIRILDWESNAFIGVAHPLVQDGHMRVVQVADM